MPGFEAILEIAEIESAVLVLEWETLPASDLTAFAKKVADLLESDFPERLGGAHKPPDGLVLTGPGRRGQIVPQSLRLQHRFSGAYRRRFDLATEFVRKHWAHVVREVVEHKAVTPVFLGVVMNLQSSVLGQDINHRRSIATLISAPDEYTPLDADLRVAFGDQSRFLVNLRLGTYAAHNLKIEEAGPKQGLSIDGESDRGFSIGIDVNTRFNFVTDGGAIDVRVDDLERILELQISAYEESLPSLLQMGRLVGEEGK